MYIVEFGEKLKINKRSYIQKVIKKLIPKGVSFFINTKVLSLKDNLVK